MRPTFAGGSGCSRRRPRTCAGGSGPGAGSLDLAPEALDLAPEALDLGAGGSGSRRLPEADLPPGPEVRPVEVRPVAEARPVPEPRPLPERNRVRAAVAAHARRSRNRVAPLIDVPPRALRSAVVPTWPADAPSRRPFPGARGRHGGADPVAPPRRTAVANRADLRRAGAGRRRGHLGGERSAVPNSPATGCGAPRPGRGLSSGPANGARLPVGRQPATAVGATSRGRSPDCRGLGTVPRWPDPLPQRPQECPRSFRCPRSSGRARRWRRGSRTMRWRSSVRWWRAGTARLGRCWPRRWWLRLEGREGLSLDQRRPKSARSDRRVRDPDGPSHGGHALLGEALYAIGDYNAALVAFTKALRRVRATPA